ncbi:MAG: hypothetical protein QM640_05515 [Niabella sp.]
MKTFIIVSLLYLLSSCNLGGEQFIVKKETRYENINGNKKRFTIIKKLRKQDQLPVSVFTKNENDGSISETMDSLYYDANGNISGKKSFIKESNNWVPVKTKS